MMHEDYDPQDCAPDWRTLSTSSHTARTPKTCQICQGPIEPGQRYKKMVALIDGEFAVLCDHEDKDVCRTMAAAVERHDREMAEKAWTWHCQQCGRDAPCDQCVAW